MKYHHDDDDDEMLETFSYYWPLHMKNQFVESAIVNILYDLKSCLKS